MTDRTRRRPRLSDLPELATRIGLQGVPRHNEVGGAVCFGIIVAVVAAQQIADGR